MLSGGNMHFIHICEERRQTQRMQDFRERGRTGYRNRNGTSQGSLISEWGLWLSYPPTSMSEAWRSIRLFIRGYADLYCLGIHSHDKGQQNQLRCWLLWLNLCISVSVSGPDTTPNTLVCLQQYWRRDQQWNRGAGKTSYCPHCPQTYPVYWRPMESQRLRGRPSLWLSPCWDTHLTSEALDWRWNLLSWSWVFETHTRTTLVIHYAWLPSCWLQMVGLSGSLSTEVSFLLNVNTYYKHGFCEDYCMFVFMCYM